jgi:hypothetical protein
MVMLMTAGPVVVYRILDGAGRAIGEVVQPRSAPKIGRWAGTVLLSRDETENCSGDAGLPVRRPTGSGLRLC